MRVRWKGTRKNNKKPKAANIKSKIDHKPNGGPEMKISGEREKENTKLIYAPFVFGSVDAPFLPGRAVICWEDSGEMAVSS